MIRQILITAAARIRILLHPLVAAHPFSIIANFMIMQLITRISPSTILSFLTVFVRNISEMIMSIGVVSTIRIVLGIRHALNIRAVPTVLKDILRGRANPIAIETITRILEPEWLKLLRNHLSFRKILNVILSVLTIFLFLKPVILLFYRTIFVSLFTVLGIVYTPLFSSFKTLRKLAIYILSFLPDSFFPYLPDKIRYFYRKYCSWSSWIPSLSIFKTKSKLAKVKEMGVGFNSTFFEEKSFRDKNKNYIYTILGITFLLFIWDYKYPDTPYVHQIVDSLRSGFNYVSTTIVWIRTITLYPFTSILDSLSPAAHIRNLFTILKNKFNRNVNRANVDIPTQDNPWTDTNKDSDKGSDSGSDIGSDITITENRTGTGASSTQIPNDIDNPW
uniref:Uncharacterized protein n=1 Tax=Taiwanofungus camphoratus TaxID=2696576 RepID=A0A4D6SU85_TAICA|nr:hypothetical protein [Taiwanofungus camphoratus]QCG69999.1 hypothetical protein [Taiwanofungus camphoratus]